MATDEELARLGRPTRNYYSDDQDWWYLSCTDDERSWTANGVQLVEEVLGISWMCFAGTGITEQFAQSAGIPSRVFFVRNRSLSSITYQVQDLGVPDDGFILA